MDQDSKPEPAKAEDKTIKDFKEEAEILGLKGDALVTWVTSQMKEEKDRKEREEREDRALRRQHDKEMAEIKARQAKDEAEIVAKKEEVMLKHEREMADIRIKEMQATQKPNESIVNPKPFVKLNLTKFDEKCDFMDAYIDLV